MPRSKPGVKKPPKNKKPKGKGGKAFVGAKASGSLNKNLPIPSGQIPYLKEVTAGTGLSPRVVVAWMLLEGGPDDNVLNIGPGNSYGSAEEGGKAASDLLHTDLYKGVLASAGKSDKEQISAIADSPWCPNCPGYEQQLLNVYNTRTKGVTSNPIKGTNVLGMIDNAVGKVVPDPLEDIVKFLARLFEPEFWLRVGKVILGVIILIVALVLFMKAVGGGVGRFAKRATPAGRIVGKVA